jgi:hypothetical protein
VYVSPRDASLWSVRTWVRFVWVFVNGYGLLWLFMVVASGLLLLAGFIMCVCVQSR